MNKVSICLTLFFRNGLPRHVFDLGLRSQAAVCFIAMLSATFIILKHAAVLKVEVAHDLKLRSKLCLGSSFPKKNVLKLKTTLIIAGPLLSPYMTFMLLFLYLLMEYY